MFPADDRVILLKVPNLTMKTNTRSFLSGKRIMAFMALVVLVSLAYTEAVDGLRIVVD